MRSLMWFRADLRVRDNTALLAASRHSVDGVVGVFTICPEQWRRHDWADIKVDFLLRNLCSLRDSLASLNIPLVVITTPTFAGVPAELTSLAARVRSDAIYFNREYELNEARRDEAVVRSFHASGLAANIYTDQAVIPPEEFRTGDGKVYTVFTPFKRAYLNEIRQRGGVRPAPAPKPQRPIEVEPSPIPTAVIGFNAATARPDLWPEGEDHALARLRKFISSRLGDYKDRRDFPGESGTSTLSPYLTLGILSIRQCLHAAAEANGGRYEGGTAGAATWISELVWRDFYKHVLAGFPRVCMGRAFKTATDRIRWNRDDGLYQAWCEGRTGVPIVDAGMRQLLQTGWMHNRVRMITAMYLTKDLFIDWRRGERHFMRHLVDGDFSQNNGGWQWSASTGTDAAPYFRIFNPAHQSRRFDPTGAYIRRFVPELASLDDDSIHEPWSLPPLVRRAIVYPEPIVDHTTARNRTIAAFKALRDEPHHRQIPASPTASQPSTPPLSTDRSA